MSHLFMPVAARDHLQGPADALVTLVEYGDYECPYCGSAYLVVKALQRLLGEQLRFVFRNFPLTNMHPHAQSAAEAAEAAGVQGRFWEMHDMLYEHQQDLGRSALVRHALGIGIEPTRFDGDLREHTFAARVREDFMSGVRSGVNGTPTFFVNGVRHDGPSDEEGLLSSIEAAAAHAALRR